MADGAPVSGRSTEQLTNDAITRFRFEGRRGIDWTWDHADSTERLMFERWLVDTYDPLALEPGTQEWRFRMFVMREAGESMVGANGAGRLVPE